MPPAVARIVAAAPFLHDSAFHPPWDGKMSISHQATVDRLTDRPTDHACYSVATGHILLAAMWPINNTSR